MESNFASPTVCALIAVAVAIVAVVSGCSFLGNTQQPGQTSGLEGTIESLRYAKYGTMAEPYFSYEITTTENGQAVLSYSTDLGQSSGTGVLSQAQLEFLGQALSEAGVASWNGFRGSNPDVLDGTSFSFSMKTTGGTSISASGSNNYPRGYSDANTAIQAAFAQVISEGLAAA